MNIYYRISDKSYDKPKLPGATKQFCLMNFVNIFKDVFLENSQSMTIIADHCKESLDLDLVKYSPFKKIETNFGNSGSFEYALRIAVNNPGIVYFVEDDYIHRDGAPKIIEEGLKIADYVTLYDHPEKYTNIYNFGEISQVRKTKHSHWRYTRSTCMTFAAKSSTLLEDINIWLKHLRESHPNDHLAFTELNEKGRKLAVCIPGAACHTDLTFSGIAREVLMEEWALNTLSDYLETKLADELKDIKKAVFANNPKGWDRLKILDALNQTKNPAN